VTFDFLVYSFLENSNDFYNNYVYELIKIKGHQPSKEKDNLARLFSLVDKASRKALRKALDSKSISTIPLFGNL